MNTVEIFKMLILTLVESKSIKKQSWVCLENREILMHYLFILTNLASHALFKIYFVDAFLVYIFDSFKYLKMTRQQ